MLKPIKIWNDVGDEFTIMPAHRPMCAQCLNPMILVTYTFSSQRSCLCRFECHHKQATRLKTRRFAFNQKGQVSQWK